MMPRLNVERCIINENKLILKDTRYGYSLKRMYKYKTRSRCARDQLEAGLKGCSRFKEAFSNRLHKHCCTDVKTTNPFQIV